MISQKRKAPYSPTTQNGPSLKKSRSEANGRSSLKEPSLEHPPLPSILPEYEDAVFTHTSVGLRSHDSTKMMNYERLEFLGDAQLEHIASLALWDRFPSATPKNLSTMREGLIRNETLHGFAKMYHFDARLKTSINGFASGKSTQNHKERQKMYADVFEAYVAACILSDSDYYQGFLTAKAWLLQLWEPILDQFARTTMDPTKNDTTSKLELSRTVLMTGVRLNYVEERPVIVDRHSGVHKHFIGVYLSGLGYDNQYLGSGTGDSKPSAGQDAARNALQNPLMNEIKQRRAKLLDAQNSPEDGKVVGTRRANAAELGSEARRETKTETTPKG